MVFRFEFPELNNPEKMSSKVVSNLLYYQVCTDLTLPHTRLETGAHDISDKLLRLRGPRVPHCLLLCSLEDVVHRYCPRHR